MLKKINEGGVESSQGFSIQITGPEVIKYIYKSYSVELEINHDSKSRKAYIYASDINDWYQGAKRIHMSPADKHSMIQNIKEAVKLLTGDFEVV